MAGKFSSFAKCSRIALPMCTPKSPLARSSPLALRYGTATPMNV